MSESALPPSSSDDLQFMTAESGDVNSPATPLGKNCAACGQLIVSTYFAVADQVVCPTCFAQINAPITGSRLGRFVKASLMGLGAGLVGAVIWLAVRRMAHLEAGLIAILVGFLVGKAVYKGSGGRGGLGYQVLAVVITYCCIAANYMPDVVEAMFSDPREQQEIAAQPDARNQAEGDAIKEKVDAVAAADAEKAPPAKGGFGMSIAATALLFTFAFAFSLALPFLQGADNLIGLLIIGFALWEAWKLNTHRPLLISGPYQLGPSPAA